MNVERHSWCAGVLSLSRPGALRGIRAGSQGPGGGGRRGGWRVYWLGCARAGQTRIGGTGGSNPDWERARSNPDREHGRVKSETGEAPPRKKRKKEKEKLVVATTLAGIGSQPRLERWLITSALQLRL